MGLFKFLFGKQGSAATALLSKGALVIDVRTPAEFKRGHHPGSKNIPLDALGDQIEQLKQKNKPVVTCCASGMRSARAANMLNAAGIESANGGPWQRISKLRERA